MFEYYSVPIGSNLSTKLRWFSLYWLVFYSKGTLQEWYSTPASQISAFEVEKLYKALPSLIYQDLKQSIVWLSMVQM